VSGFFVFHPRLSLSYAPIFNEIGLSDANFVLGQAKILKKQACVV
jgi:hypothetical protein